MRADFVKKYMMSCVIGSVLVLMTGCGPRAYKITPVPAEQKLQEEVLIDEGGLFPPKIVLIDVEGVLINRHEPELIGEGEHPVSLFTEKLQKAAQDSGAKALVVRINSPGGTVTASDIMYRELQHYKQVTKGKRPVVAVLMDVGASGGYYLACGCDSIVANPTTVTGSIGVIMQMINFAGTMQKIGVEAEAITSGPMKDAGSPFSRLTEEEREIFQGLVNDFYDRFVEVVAAGREEMDEEEVRKLADGRVYSAEQALALGFVDRVGTLRDALADIKAQLDVERVKVVTYKRPMGWKPNIYAQQPGGQPQVNMVNIGLDAEWLHPEPRFMYLWAPGVGN